MSLSWSRQVGIHEVSSPCSGGLVLLGLALRALVGLLLTEQAGAPVLGSLLGYHIPRGSWEQDREGTVEGGRILPPASRHVEVPEVTPGGCSNAVGKGGTRLTSLTCKFSLNP